MDAKAQREASQRLAYNFENFNPYAREAQQDGENADVQAILALAFEISQLRYMMTRGRGNNHHG